MLEFIVNARKSARMLSRDSNEFFKATSYWV